MINVSAEFKELMKTRTDFKQYAEITLTDGAMWAVDDSDFTVDNNSVTDAAGADGLPLGAVVSRTIQIELMNDDGRFADVDFMGAEIRLYLTFQLSETVERVELGYFTVISPETYGETVIIEAIDNSWKLDKPYTTTLKYPQTAGAVFSDICARCSVLFESATFRNYDFVIDNAPDDGMTNAEMIGYIAMIAGGNARFNRSGKLEILTYEFPAFDVEEERNYDGGTFDDWDSGDTLDGGTFDDWASGDDADGGAFDPWDSSSGSGGGNIVVDDDTHVLTNWISLKPFTEDIIITGIQTTKTVEDGEGNETETPVMYGADGYVLSIENPLIKGREEAALALIGDVLIGAHIRNFEGEHIGYPLAEFMDKAVIVDRKGNAMPTVLTDINFNFFGITTMANSAAPPLRLSSKYNSAAAQAIIAAKDLVAKEKTQRELAIEALNTALSNSSGLYPTKVVQPDGSIISYLHDKPTLEESQTVIKVTAEAIGVSNDGGDTYTYGFFTNGDAILKILQAEGINADWINAGALTVTDEKGNVLFQADVGTGNVVIDGNAVNITLNGQQTSIPGAFNLYVKKTDNNQIVSMLNASANDINITGDRIQILSKLFKLYYNGEIESTGGTIGGFTITGRTLESNDGTYPVVLDTKNGDITAGNLTMSGGGTNIGQLGITNSLGGSYIMFREDSGTYGLSLFAATGKKIRMYSPTFFNDAVQFTEMPTFPTKIPVSEGGTGKGSFTSNAVLLGNDSSALKAASTYSGAFYSTSQGGLPRFGTLPIAQGGTGATSAKAAREALGIYSGQISLTGNGNSYIDSDNISLPNAADYVITVSPRNPGDARMTCGAFGANGNVFRIRVQNITTWSAGTRTFDWIAVNKS